MQEKMVICGCWWHLALFSLTFSLWYRNGDLFHTIHDRHSFLDYTKGQSSELMRGYWVRSWLTHKVPWVGFHCTKAQFLFKLIEVSPGKAGPDWEEVKSDIWVLLHIYLLLTVELASFPSMKLCGMCLPLGSRDSSYSITVSNSGSLLHVQSTSLNWLDFSLVWAWCPVLGNGICVLFPLKLLDCFEVESEHFENVFLVFWVLFLAVLMLWHEALQVYM